MAEGAHARLLAAAGLQGPPATRLAAYLDLVAAWSLRVNLTGARTPEERVDVLVRPVLPLAPLVRPGRLLDVGSGNGSPGLVLAALRDDLAVTLLEPRQKRWAFLREAARAIGRPEVDARRERLEEYAGPPADTVTVRALGLPARAVAAALAPAGTAWAFGGAIQDDGSLVSAPGPGDLVAWRRP
ncbi:MAG TPA: RsmG family class I SAM-dependent methyltransferase [Vicinamibacteria bacterium]|nr:RsmG family class I SAM-dependent methyltransferase [Vicinamibacteria bacterium]